MLFLWKLFQFVSLLITLASLLIANTIHAVINPTIFSFLLTSSTIYAVYTAILLCQLWNMERIRAHYRQLPTRPERPVDQIGFLAFGSFSFRRQVSGRSGVGIPTADPESGSRRLGPDSVGA